MIPAIKPAVRFFLESSSSSLTCGGPRLPTNAHCDPGLRRIRDEGEGIPAQPNYEASELPRFPTQRSQEHSRAGAVSCSQRSTFMAAAEERSSGFLARAFI